MAKQVVVLVERQRSPTARARHQAESFAEALSRRYDVISVPSGRQALSVVQTASAAIIILDAMSMKTSGERIARSLKEAFPAIPLIHLFPTEQTPDDSPAEILLKPPFTARKLVNAIERLTHRPQSGSIISCGPFTMDINRRVLIVSGQETQLTPKLALLVETFLRNPGVVLPRKTLMERVWQTDYMGDTRTLDVHVRWIRRAIEADPGAPVYLKTVRGVGYRLDIDPEPAVELTTS